MSKIKPGSPVMTPGGRVATVLHSNPEVDSSRSWWVRRIDGNVRVYDEDNLTLLEPVRPRSPAESPAPTPEMAKAFWAGMRDTACFEGAYNAMCKVAPPAQMRVPSGWEAVPPPGAYAGDVGCRERSAPITGCRISCHARCSPRKPSRGHQRLRGYMNDEKPPGRLAVARALMLKEAVTVTVAPEGSPRRHSALINVTECEDSLFGVVAVRVTASVKDDRSVTFTLNLVAPSTLSWAIQEAGKILLGTAIVIEQILNNERK